VTNVQNADADADFNTIPKPNPSPNREPNSKPDLKPKPSHNPTITSADNLNI